MTDSILHLYENCRLCPRSCGINRLAGEKGACKESAQLSLARAALHYWEEPCISGEEGSGAVFFSGCSLGCIYCQNREISTGESGKEISTERLSQIFLELQAKGANNINLVTPDHYAPSIILALQMVRGGLHIPIVCNCSGYMAPDTVRLLAPYVDIWLTDFKYMSPDLSRALSGARDYFRTADRALSLMLESAGDPLFDERGLMQRGIIVRHLVLPGHSDDSIRIIRHLHRKYQDHIYISIMNQYTPPARKDEKEPWLSFPELMSPLTEKEYDLVTDEAIKIGVVNGFIQEGGTAAESFIPAFDCSGV